MNMRLKKYNGESRLVYRRWMYINEIDDKINHFYENPCILFIHRLSMTHLLMNTITGELEFRIYVFSMTHLSQYWNNFKQARNPGKSFKWDSRAVCGQINP